MPTFAAVDLGATSGRVVNVTVDAGTVELDEVHRFPNAPVGETSRSINFFVPRLRRYCRAGAGITVLAVFVARWRYHAS